MYFLFVALSLVSGWLAAPPAPLLPPEKFVGGLLGVKAEVLLDRNVNRATVSLSGAPVGGRVSGDAEFGQGGEKDVVVHGPLSRVLARRFVKIVDARHDDASDRVFVTVSLPMLLGKHTITLNRVDG